MMTPRRSMLALAMLGLCVAPMPEPAAPTSPPPEVPPYPGPLPPPRPSNHRHLATPAELAAATKRARRNALRLALAGASR